MNSRSRRRSGVDHRKPIDHRTSGKPQPQKFQLPHNVCDMCYKTPFSARFYTPAKKSLSQRRLVRVTLSQ